MSEIVQNLFSFEWVSPIVILGGLVAFLLILASILAGLDNFFGVLEKIGVPVGRVGPWIHIRLKGICGCKRKICGWATFQSLRVWNTQVDITKRLYKRWNWISLTKGWRNMKANLHHTLDDLQRPSSPEIKKICVAIKLNGIALKLDANGQASTVGTTLIFQVIGNNDKEIMLNAHARSPEKYSLFLANLACAIVDGWDDMLRSARLDELNESETEKFVRKQVAWLMQHEIPHKVLMDYLGDVLECNGEWKT